MPTARIGAPRTLLFSGVFCLAGAAWLFANLGELRREVRPIYQELGILPEIAESVQYASVLRTPPEE